MREETEAPPREPIVAACENRLVEDAVVEKKLVVVPAVRESVPRVERPVTPSVEESVAAPEAESVPTLALWANRFVDEAVVAKNAVVVALVAERLPVIVRSVPLKVRLAESVKAPAVVAYGTRLALREETVRLVVDAVAKYPVPDAVKAVVEAPPFILKRPLVIVEEALEMKPLVKVVRPVCVKVPFTVRLLPKVAAPFWLMASAATVEVAP